MDYLIDYLIYGIVFLGLWGFFPGCIYLIWVQPFKITEMDFSLNDGEEIIRWAPVIGDGGIHGGIPGVLLDIPGTLYITNKRILLCQYVAKKYGFGIEKGFNSDFTWWFGFTRAKIISFEYIIGTPAEFQFIESTWFRYPEFLLRKPNGEYIHLGVLRRTKAMTAAISEALKKIASE